MISRKSYTGPVSPDHGLFGILDKGKKKLDNHRRKVADPMMRERGDQRFKGCNGVSWREETDHWEVWLPNREKWIRVCTETAVDYSRWIGEGSSGVKLRLISGPYQPHWG